MSRITQYKILISYDHVEIIYQVIYFHDLISITIYTYRYTYIHIYIHNILYRIPLLRIPFSLSKIISTNGKSKFYINNNQDK